MMSKLIRIVNTPPTGEAVIRVYKNRICLNAEAVKLLDMDGDSRLSWYKDKEQEEAGRMRVYIGKSRTGYQPRMRGDVLRVNSAKLSAALAEALDGYGAYRICPEDCLEENGNKCYNIFFRKYD